MSGKLFVIMFIGCFGNVVKRFLICLVIMIVQGD